MKDTNMLIRPFKLEERQYNGEDKKDKKVKQMSTTYYTYSSNKNRQRTLGAC